MLSFSASTNAQRDTVGRVTTAMKTVLLKKDGKEKDRSAKDMDTTGLISFLGSAGWTWIKAE